jgi:hypothetical protein
MRISNYLIFVFILSLLFFGGKTTIAIAHPGHYGSPFHAHHLDQALEFAAQEHRVVFLHVREDDGKRLQLFKWPSDENASLLDLLVRETVIVELDAVENATELSAYAVNPPEILLLNPDGSERDRMDGRLPMPALAWRLQKTLTGGDAVQRAKLNIEAKGQTDFFSRERLAAALQSAGADEQAVVAYRWCASQCISGSSLAAKGRRPKVFAALAEYANEKPVAKALLDEVLSEAETVLRLERDDSKLANDLVQIYRRGYKERAVALFDRLDERSRARHGLLDYLFDDLVDAGRHAELLTLIDPETAFEGEVERYRRNRILRPAMAENGRQRGSRAFVIRRSAGLIQALAGEAENSKARRLIDNVLKFDDKETTRKMVRQSLGRVNRIDLMQVKQ